MIEILQNLGVYFLIPVISYFLSSLCFPSIVFISKERNLYDDMELHRKDHKHLVSRLGGIGIFCSFTITALMFILPDNHLKINYVLTSCIILFAMGIKDDLKGVNPKTKFLIQIAAALVLVILGNVRLTGLYGIFGIGEIPMYGQILLTVFVILLIVNSFNLIDGINTLAGSLGVLMTGCFGILFAMIGEQESAFISLALMGALIGFLRYNVTPARLFMGDTGSMLIGLIAAVLCIRFIQASTNFHNSGVLHISSAPLLALSILVVPIYDTLRVFTLRIAKGYSPFKADRNHLHHILTRSVKRHERATFILLVFNVFVILTVVVFDKIGNFQLFILVTCLALLFSFILQVTSKKGRNMIWRKAARQYIKLQGN